MADLGSIPFVNPNAGVQEPDRRMEAATLAQGLQTVAGIANEAILTGVERKMNRALDEAAAVSVATVSTSTDVGEPPKETATFSEKEKYLLNRFDRLNQVMAQGSVSQQTLAEMELQNIMVQAQIRFPWLKQQILQRGGMVASSSYQMSKIGLHDKVRKEAADLASARYKAMTDQAYERVENGGMGIPMSLPPESAAFRAMYLQRSDVLHRAQLYELRAMDLRSSSGFKFQDVAPEMDQFLSGTSGGVKTMWDVLDAKYNMSFGLKTDINGTFNLEEVERIKRMGPQIMADIARVKAGLQDDWNSTYMKPEYMGLPEAQDRQKKFEAVLAGYDQMSAAIQAVIDNTPGAAEQLKIKMDLINNSMFNNLDPEGQRRVTFLNSYGTELLPVIANLNPEDLVFKNFLSSLISGDAKTMLEAIDQHDPGAVSQVLFNSTGTLNLLPGATAEDIRQAIRSRHMDPNNTWAWPTLTQQDGPIASWVNFETHEKMFQLAEQTLPNASRQYADNMLLGLTYSMEYFNGTTVRPSNLIQKQLEAFGRTNIENALNKASPEIAKAFAQAAEQFYNNTNPTAVLNTAKTQHQQQRVMGTKYTWYDLIRVSSDNILKGEFSYYTDTATRNAIVNAYAYGSGITQEEAIRRVDQAINDHMGGLIKVMNQQVRINQAVQQGKGSPMSWAELFFGSNTSLDPTTGTWASVFHLDNNRGGI